MQNVNISLQNEIWQANACYFLTNCKTLSKTLTSAFDFLKMSWTTDSMFSHSALNILATCCSCGCTTCDKKCFTVSRVSADWHAL